MVHALVLYLWNKGLGMKRIWILLLCSLTIAAEAQTVAINVHGNRNRQVIVNNTTYEIDNNNINNLSKNITITNLRPGEYSLQLLRRNDFNPNDDEVNESRSSEQLPLLRTTTTFRVRAGFDVAINIAPNGIVQVKEKQIVGTTSDPTVAMADDAFSTLLTDIQFHWRNTRRITAAQTALTNNNNYFSTQQVLQILQTVEGESNRLTLARLAYNRITDPANFVQVYSLMSEPASRDELATMVRQNSNGSTTIASYSESFRQEMNEANFDILLQKIKRNTDASLRVNEVTEIMSNQTNYFTTDQVRRLIELVEYESSRLQLLRDVYNHVTDRSNFRLLYSLLNTDAARIQLINYIKDAEKSFGLINYNMNKPALSEENYAAILNQTREAAQVGGTIPYLTNTFGNIAFFFSAQQAVQLISLVDGELNRLSLAKAAYRGIVDPDNFLVLMNQLLASPLTRNELNDFAYTYRAQ
jgi:DNA polymerase IIIc chi subunit